MNGYPAVLTRGLTRSALAVVLLASAVTAQAEPVFALTNNAIFTFDSASPGITSTTLLVTGLPGGVALMGIDLRPTTGVLYGIGSNSTIYTINTTTGAATVVGTVFGGVPLTGAGFGIDFNPVLDLDGFASLRITGGTTNLRIDVDSFATNIEENFGSNSPAATSSLSAVAYTNNDRDPATGTSLYGISAGLLYQVINPNAGTNALVGPLGAPNVVYSATGFDISGLSGLSFASLVNGGTGFSSFYTINLLTGAATLVGAFPFQIGVVRDITAATQAPRTVTPIPEPETYALMMVGLAGLGWISRRRRR